MILIVRLRTEFFTVVTAPSQLSFPLILTFELEFTNRSLNWWRRCTGVSFKDSIFQMKDQTGTIGSKGLAALCTYKEATSSRERHPILTAAQDSPYPFQGSVAHGLVTFAALGLRIPLQGARKKLLFGWLLSILVPQRISLVIHFITSQKLCSKDRICQWHQVEIGRIEGKDYVRPFNIKNCGIS